MLMFKTRAAFELFDQEVKKHTQHFARWCEDFLWSKELTLRRQTSKVEGKERGKCSRCVSSESVQTLGHTLQLQDSVTSVW